jgi:hypothetical protein
MLTYGDARAAAALMAQVFLPLVDELPNP